MEWQSNHCFPTASRKHGAPLAPSFRKLALIAIPILCSCLTACETKSAARTQASLAYVQGRRAGENAAAKSQEQKLEVIVHGEVTNNHIPWTRELTLSRAIVAAGYKGVIDPGAIDVIHEGVSTRFLPKQLLRGEDVELDPGDVIEIRPFSQVH